MSEQFDVVVIGSGMAGCATALACAARGLEVLMLEKTDLLGGGTALSWGGLWVGNNHVARSVGFHDTHDDALSYLRFIGGGSADDAYVQTYVTHAPMALQALDDLGLRFQVTRGFPDHYYPAAPGSTEQGRHLEVLPTSADSLGAWKDRIRGSTLEPHCLTCEDVIAFGGINNHRKFDHDMIDRRNRLGQLGRGRGLIAQMLAAMLRVGVTVQLEQPVADLTMDGGRAVGVTTKSGRSISARRGVVLATGGYEGDATLAQHYEGLPGWVSMFPPGVDGDGMRLGTRAGGGVSVIRDNLSLQVGFEVPGSDANGDITFRLSTICELLYPHTIVVNADGRRFCDETYFQDMAVALRHYDIWKRRYANLPCYLVFDSQYVDNFSFCGLPPGTTPPAWVRQSSTIEGLARQLGVSPEGLRSTVERYNTLVAAGDDRDFGRGKNRWTLASKDRMDSGQKENRTLGSLSKAPFFGLPLSPSAFASAGLLKSTQARVLRLDGTHIDGLYAVGNAAFHAEYGTGYQAGTSLGSAMTFGYLAAQEMAR